MGYRNIGNNVFGKPFAYHLLTVRMIDGALVFQNFFVGANKKILLWDSGPLKTGSMEEILNSIKSAEYATRLDVGQPYQNAGNDFSFLTKEEEIAEMME